MHETIQKAAEAIEPRAFIGTPDDIHRFCSSTRVDVAQERIIAKAKSSLRAALQSGVLAEVRDALDILTERCGKIPTSYMIAPAQRHFFNAWVDAKDALTNLDKLMKELE